MLLQQRQYYMSKVMDETEQVPLYTEATDGRN